MEDGSEGLGPNDTCCCGRWMPWHWRRRFFMGSLVAGAFVLLFSIISDATMTYDAVRNIPVVDTTSAPYYPVFRHEDPPDRDVLCRSDGTIHPQLQAGLAFLSIAWVMTALGITLLLAVSQCGCSLCNSGCSCDAVISRSLTAMSGAIICIVLSFPLFTWNVSLIAAFRDGCMYPYEASRADLVYNLLLVRAGVGTVAGLLGCMGLACAGYFVTQTPAAVLRLKRQRQVFVQDNNAYPMQVVNSMQAPGYYGVQQPGQHSLYGAPYEGVQTAQTIPAAVAHPVAHPVIVQGMLVE